MINKEYKVDEIYNEDSYNAIKKLPSKCIDLIVIDPPYLIDKHGSGGAFGVRRKKFHDEIRTLADGIKYDILEELVRVMKRINIYIFCNKEQILEYLLYFVKQKKCYFDLLVWHKLNPIPTCNNKYLSDTEYILFFREKGVKLYGNYKSKSKYFITEKNVKDKKLYKHPTIKPLPIIQTLIFNSSLEGDIVGDFFIGSGTTAVASKLLNRHYIGFEVNPSYFQTAKNRLQNITKQGVLQLETQT